MAMMDICSDLEDRQTSTMHEASLLALRVWKVGRSARSGLGNPNPNSGNSGGDGAKALSFGSKEFSLAAKGSSVFSAHDANEGPKETDILASERLLNKGKLATAVPETSSSRQRWSSKWGAPSTGSSDELPS